jgi:hypothetical protein
VSGGIGKVPLFFKKRGGEKNMVTVHTPKGKKECTELKQVRFKLVVDSEGLEWLVVQELRHKSFLYEVGHSQEDRMEFTYADRIERLEIEPAKQPVMDVVFFSKTESKP